MWHEAPFAEELYADAEPFDDMDHENLLAPDLLARGLSASRRHLLVADNHLRAIRGVVRRRRARREGQGQPRVARSEWPRPRNESCRKEWPAIGMELPARRDVGEEPPRYASW